MLQAGPAKEAEIVIELVPLKYQDATGMVNTLSQVFSRLQIGVSGGGSVLPGGFGGRVRTAGRSASSRPSGRC